MELNTTFILNCQNAVHNAQHLARGKLQLIQLLFEIRHGNGMITRIHMNNLTCNT